MVGLAQPGALREALDSVTQPAQLDTLAAAANPTFPAGDELAGVLDPTWPTRAAETVAGCERAVEGWTPKLHGFAPDVLGLDLRGDRARSSTPPRRRASWDARAARRQPSLRSQPSLRQAST